MKPDQVRLQALLKDTITILCQNSVKFGKELKVQGLLGITVDGENILIVHVNESYVTGASVCDQSNDLDFNKERLPDSATESVQRELCEEDTWKQKSQDFVFTREIGRNNSSTVYTTDYEEFDENSVAQNVHTEKSRRLSRNSDGLVRKTALKQKSRNVKTLNLSPDRQPLGRATKKFSSNKTEERIWVSDVSNGSLQASEIEPIIKSETGFAGQQRFEVGSNGALIDTQSYINQSDFSDPEMAFDDGQCVMFSSSNNPDYKPRRRTSTFQFSRPNRSFGRPSNIWKKPYRYQQNALIMTKSFHICGYPDCGKQFHHRRHLLRHQTQKHGRIPTRHFDPTKRAAWPFVFESIDSNLDDCHIREFIDPENK